jgi:hypothetical protein
VQQKVALFRRLFRGRDDIYALRWESRTSGRSGYAPACANEWKPGICEKPRLACRDCSHRELLPVTDAAIYGHLAGEHTHGAVDFDEQDWREDARAFLRSCLELAVPAALEISRSGEGAMGGCSSRRRYRPGRPASGVAACWWMPCSGANGRGRSWVCG